MFINWVLPYKFFVGAYIYIHLADKYLHIQHYWQHYLHIQHY